MPPTAIVVGAGIGGLATAIALRQADFEVTILERRPALQEVGYAIDVPPNATRILKQFGMDLKSLHGCRQKQLDVFKADVEPMVLLRSDSRDIGDEAPFLGVHRVDYHEALRHFALYKGGKGKPAELRCNSKVVEFDSERGTVRLDSGEVLEADVIVAADGNASRAHVEILGKEIPAKPTGWNNVRFTIPSSVLQRDENTKQLVENTKEGMCVYIDNYGNYIAHYACRSGELQNFGLYQDEEGASEKHAHTTFQKMAKERLSHVGKAISSLATHVQEEGTYLWRIVDRDPLEKIGAGKLVLVGDACHPMPPRMGQGAAQAVEDAAVLGAVLQGVHSANEISDRLELWEKLRRPRASAIQLMSRTNPATAGWTNPEDQAKAAQYFPDGELPLTRPEMTSWTYNYDAVADAKALMRQHLLGVGDD